MGEERLENTSVSINEVQLILAEKRTSLAVMRTGIAVLALPLSVTSLLIATSKYYDILHVLHFLIPLLALNSGLVVLGVYLIMRSIRRLHHHDELITRIKAGNAILQDVLD